MDDSGPPSQSIFRETPSAAIIREIVEPRSYRSLSWAGASAVVIAVGARVVYLLGRPFWFDEFFTLWISRRTPAGIARALRLDSGPPLFYLLEMPFVRLGEMLGTDTVARALPFAAGGAADLGSPAVPGRHRHQ